MFDALRKKSVQIGLAVLGCSLAFAAGRFSAPEKVETREVEKVVFKDRIVEKRVEVAAAEKVVTKIVWREKVVTPDGTTTEREKEVTGSEEKTKTETVATKEAVKEVYRDREVVKTVTLRPDWRVGVLAGAQLREPLLPIAGPLVLGISLDRRIIGGLSVGVWGNTGGAAGAAVTLEF